MDVGKRIRELRESRRMDQLELANKINVSQSKMNKIETGYQKRLEADLLVSISTALGVSVDYLVGKTDSPYTSGVFEDKAFYVSKIAKEFPDIDLMFKDMESLTAEEMEEVYEYIKFKMSQKKEG